MIIVWLQLCKVWPEGWFVLEEAHGSDGNCLIQPHRRQWQQDQTISRDLVFYLTIKYFKWLWQTPVPPISHIREVPLMALGAHVCMQGSGTWSGSHVFNMDVNLSKTVSERF